MVIGVVALGDLASARRLVERALLEADRERPQATCRLLRRERGQKRGVDTARKEDADRDVADQVRAHRVAHARPQLLAQLAGGLVALFAGVHRQRPGEPFQSHLTVLPDEQVPGRQLARLAEDREGRRDEVEGEVGLERVEVDLSSRQGAELRREAQLALFVPVVERLDAEAVAREHEPALARVPDRHGEHTAQAGGEVEPVLLVEMGDHLGVAVAREAVAGRHQLGTELAVVVDLAVLDDVYAAALVCERLVAGVEVDNREPARGDADAALEEASFAVGAAVGQLRIHCRQLARVGATPGRGDPTYSAHGNGV